jgi:hypothetical protein
MVGIRQVLGVLGVCSPTDLLDDGHLVLAAESDRELMWPGTAMRKKAGYRTCAFTDGQGKCGIGNHSSVPGDLR